MENNLCKKCQKPLPDGYKHKKCEACRNKAVQNLKNGGKAALGVAVFVGSTAIAIATKGKIDLNSKK